MSQSTPEVEADDPYELDLALIELKALRADNECLRRRHRRLLAAHVAFESLLARAADGYISGSDPDTGAFDLDVSAMEPEDAELMVRKMMGLCRGLLGVLKPLLSLTDD